MSEATDTGSLGDEQRLAFGRVAELYDRARPSYPSAALDAVITLAGLSPGAAIFEVGAGTGKATILLARRGLRILAIEPDPEMARLARATCAPFGSAIEIVESDFERWLAPQPRAALVSAQAWHWIAPDVRYRAARDALVPGGRLVALWTVPNWPACALRGALLRVYRDLVPDMAPDFPMHPGSEPSNLAGDWPAEIAQSEWFEAPVVQAFAWSQRYTATAYAELAATHQDHILLADQTRAELLSRLVQAVESAGGALDMPYLTRVCAATRVR